MIFQLQNQPPYPFCGQSRDNLGEEALRLMVVSFIYAFSQASPTCSALVILYHEMPLCKFNNGKVNHLLTF